MKRQSLFATIGCDFNDLEFSFVTEKESRYSRHKKTGLWERVDGNSTQQTYPIVLFGSINPLDNPALPANVDIDLPNDETVHLREEINKQLMRGVIPGFVPTLVKGHRALGLHGTYQNNKVAEVNYEGVRLEQMPFLTLITVSAPVVKIYENYDLTYHKPNKILDFLARLAGAGKALPDRFYKH